MLSAIVDEDHKNLLNKFDQWELSIEQVYDKAMKTPSKFDWREALEEVKEIIGGIPQLSIQEHPGDFIYQLEEIVKQIEVSLKMARAIMTPGE